MKARVIVTLKSSVLDPQGKAIEGALKGLAVDGLTSVRQGKVFDIELDGDDHATARSYYLFLGDTTTTPTLRTMGQYDDVFVRSERGWQLAHRTITLG